MRGATRSTRICPLDNTAELPAKQKLSQNHLGTVKPDQFLLPLEPALSWAFDLGSALAFAPPHHFALFLSAARLSHLLCQPLCVILLARFLADLYSRFGLARLRVSGELWLFLLLLPQAQGWPQEYWEDLGSPTRASTAVELTAALVGFVFLSFSPPLATLAIAGVLCFSLSFGVNGGSAHCCHWLFWACGPCGLYFLVLVVVLCLVSFPNFIGLCQFPGLWLWQRPLA